MKKAFFRLTAVAAIFSVLATFVCGCGKGQSTAKKYTFPKTLEILDSRIVASNDKLELEWDGDSYCLMLRSKTNGKVWSTTPYASYEQGKFNALLSSPISITVANVSDRSLNTKQSYSACFTNGSFESKLIENGIEITYYYDDYKISIPIMYILRDNSLAVTVDNSRICEEDTYKLLSISVSPMMCSVANDDDGYLFVPAGTGALMNTNTTVDGSRTYSEQVYGDDAAQTLLERLVKEEDVKMPVFGVKDKDNAILGIVEESPGTVTISAEAGNKKTGYSNVAATVYTRGYDMYKNSGVASVSITTLTSDNIADTKTVIGYYPLEGEKADYNGMADCYRNYLTKNGMKKSEISQNAYGLRVIGNIEQKVLKLGIPITTVKSLTTFKEAQTILEDIGKATDLTPSVQLLGYGKSGIDTEKIGGEFKFTAKSGNGYKDLSKYADNNHVPLFVDFDLMFYKKSGLGISTLSGAAKSATMRKSVVYNRDYATGDYDKEAGGSYLVKQKYLSKLTDKMLKKGKSLGITGYSLSTLSSVAYSDYSEQKSYVKGSIDSAVRESIAKIKEAGCVFASTSANDYAAAFSDSIFEVQTMGYGTDNIDKYIPFYQMVFKGYIPMYSESLNLSSNRQNAILSSLETGVGFGFTVIENYDIGYASGYHNNLYSAKYDMQKDFISETVNKYSEYYGKISDAKIVKYNSYDNGVSETVFDNGIVAYINKSDSEQQTSAGNIAAKSFFYTENGVKAVAKE